ncbi:MAG: ABC transporter permease [Deltaproteobacteria bacterium]|nr:ABC transporter permease [Deltaproteobacteria bacterium]
MRFLVTFLHELGGLWLFFRDIARLSARNQKALRPLVMEQISQVAYRSMGTILFSGFFVGAILVIQFYLMLSKYDATSLLGGLSASATIREIGPLIISFLLAGKIGAYTAAEIGTMKVTEQIDAIRCLGTNPMEYLVVPRFLAIVVSSALLLFFGLLVGILGSVLVADSLYSVNALQFLESIPRFAGLWTLFGGLFKSLVYGTIVAAVSTFKGYTASGGAKGVGIAVTQCAVYTNLLITLANSFTSMMLDGFQGALSFFTGGHG